MVQNEAKIRIPLHVSLVTKILGETCKGVCFYNIIKTLIDRIRTIIRIFPLITDTQTNTLNW